MATKTDAEGEAESPLLSREIDPGRLNFAIAAGKASIGEEEGANGKDAFEPPTVESLISENARLQADVSRLEKLLRKSDRERDNAKNYAERLRQEVNTLTRELAGLRKECARLADAQAAVPSHDQYYEQRALEAAQGAIAPPAPQQIDEDSAAANPEDTSAAALVEAATAGMQQSGVVYDEASGMYYDWGSGYYFDPKSNLYYSPHYSAYYTLDKSTGQYVFHSYAPATAAEGSDKRAEEEELLCVRLVVRESPALDVGSVHVFGRDGGTIGREKDRGHVIRLADLEVSKEHVRIEFEESQYGGEGEEEAEGKGGVFCVRDLGSRNGTFLNDDRLSEKCEESNPHALRHGDELVLGSTTFVIHAHNGAQFCADCAQEFEKPLLPSKPSEAEWTSITKAPVRHSPPRNHLAVLAADPELARLMREDERRRELSQLKRKYGLEHGPSPSQNRDAAQKYEDRAARRRALHPQGSETDTYDPSAPVPAASINKPLDESNKGQKLLRKMGWAGGGLGAQEQGTTAPVPIQVRQDRAGLGSGVQPNANAQRMQARFFARG